MSTDSPLVAGQPLDTATATRGEDEPKALRRANRGPAAAAKDDQPRVATQDLLIEREDLGPGCHTLINAGDLIPAHLAALPHRAATDPPPDAP